MNHDTYDRESFVHDDPADRLEALLLDALSTPPVPASLVNRLDQGFTAAWGISPGLVHRPADSAAAALWSSMGRFKSLPIAAGLAASILLVVILAGGSTSYAWAAVLDAIAKQTMIELDAGDTKRRLAITSETAGNETERTRMLLAFVLADHPDRDYFAQQDVRVVKQSWQREDDTISLLVEFESASAKRLALRLHLDQETSLPRTVRVIGESTPSPPMTLSFKTAPTANVARTDPPIDPTATSGRDPDTLQSKSGAKQTSEALVSLPIGATTNWKPVTVSHRDDAEVVRDVNQTLRDLWKREGIAPVTRASDELMFRRAYLDLAGRTPTVTEVRSFLKDSAADRYEQLVDRLLASPDHASHFATTWRTFLIPEGVDLSAFGGHEAFDRWLAKRFADNDPYDQVVHDLLVAEGRLSKSGPLLFYSALKLDADQLAARTSRVFLGIRLECAQCHDHPFEPWSQMDFWSYAAYFAQISRPRGTLESVSTVMQVRDIDRGEVMLPDSSIIVPPSVLGASVLGANTLESGSLGKSVSTAVPDEPHGEAQNETLARRHQLARWMTSRENPYFARATVNRVWSLMFGRGIVDPVDDFGINHPPLSPELLDLLASQLIDSGFDLRRLTRTIVLTDAYRLSSGGDSEDAGRRKVFAQMEVKTLTASQLFDCIAVATLLDQPVGNRTNNAAVERFGNTQREIFLQQFSSPAENRVEYLSGIPQALTLMNGDLVSSATGTSSSAMLKSLDAPFFTDEQRVEVLFLATLSRLPTRDEMESILLAIPRKAAAQQRNEVLADLLWALLNSAEFSLNH